MNELEYLNQFEKDPKKFLNTTIMILGGGKNSGTTTIVYEIIKLLENQMPLVFVICPPCVNIESSDYYGKVPNIAIKNNIDVEWLDAFMERQKLVREIYRTANSITPLHILNGI
jgi:uridine kinase